MSGASGKRPLRRGAPPRLNEPETGAPTLRDLLANVNAASTDARNAWIASLGILAYLMVTLVGVTHKDLLLDSPTQLPFVNIGIPLKGFFIFGPLVLLFLHFGLLLQHAMLHRKLIGFNNAVADAHVHEAPNKRDIREELHSYFLTQAISGKEEDRTLVRAFHVMSAVTFTLAPLGLLLYFQIKFLPFHDEGATWLHRVCVLADAGLLLSVGAFLRRPRQAARLTRQEFFRKALLLLRSPSFLASLFSLFVATFPHEGTDRLMTATSLTIEVPIHCGFADPSPPREAFWPTAWLFETKADPDGSHTCSVVHWLSGRRNLDVADLDLVPDKQVVDGEASLRLRNRNLRYADFSRSDLKHADFTNADLRDADLGRTTLSKANLDNTQLQGASLRGAQLQGASLVAAELQSANLRLAQLQGANLRLAQLQKANLDSAQLPGANLLVARLQGANLYNAQFQGANLRGAELQGANLERAQLQGANLGFRAESVDLGIPPTVNAKYSHAPSLRTFVGPTRLQGANLRGADLQGANLDGAKLQGANLHDAQLQGASLVGAEFQGANLRGAQFQGASLVGAEFQGANLVGAEFWWTDALDIEAFEHSDTASLSLVARQEAASFSDLQKLASEMTARKTPGHIEVGATVDRLAVLQDQAPGDTQSRDWMGEKAFCAWNALRLREDRPKERGEYLGDLACGDDSEEAYTANGLAWNAVYQRFPDETKAFLDKLASCPAIKAKLYAKQLNLLDQRVTNLPKTEAPAKWNKYDGVSPKDARAICKRRARKAKPPR